MEQIEKPKWQKEIEAILHERYRGDELSKQLERANKLINTIQEVEIPSGGTGEVVTAFLRLASEGLYPLAAVYAGFQLGVAYERQQNTDRD